MGILQGLIEIVAPKKKAKAGGEALPPTYNASNPKQVLTLPAYREHLTDLFVSRQSDDSRDLIKSLLKHDPDMSAALHGYLTLSNTSPMIYATTVEGEVDETRSRDLHKLVLRLTQQVDYTAGFKLKQNLNQLCADLRYMALMRGAIAVELVYDKKGNPDELRVIDSKDLRWIEAAPGEAKPQQIVSGQTAGRSLDAPTFFISFYRRDPTDLYTHSTFVAAINTISARQQVINDLYRIMNVTGFPRIEITVLENVIIERAPENVKRDPAALRDFVDAQLSALSQTFSSIRVDQAITHTDSVEMKILNEKNPGVAVDISRIIDTLNAQNQAGLKTMSTLLGRGEKGANTGSVEARIAAMFADELNEPVAELLSKILSFCLHQDAFQGFATVSFPDAELRAETELEPQLALKASRLRQDLSDGIISDIEYSLMMYGRLPLPGAPKLAGTGFMKAAPNGAPDPTDVSPNTDPLGKSISPDKGAEQIKTPKKGTKVNQK